MHHPSHHNRESASTAACTDDAGSGNSLIIWIRWGWSPEEPLRHEAKQNPGFDSTDTARWSMGVLLSRAHTGIVMQGYTTAVMQA